MYCGPNQYVRVRVKGATRPNAILVPQRAVLQGSKGHFVWVVDKDSKAENRPVTVGDWSGDDWVITEGLRAATAWWSTAGSSSGRAWRSRPKDSQPRRRRLRRSDGVSPKRALAAQAN